MNIYLFAGYLVIWTIVSYLFAGYLVIWTIVSLYLLYLLRTQKRVSDKLQSLAEMVQRQDDAGSSSD